MKSKRMSYNAITELRGVKRIVGGGIRKERKARRNSERGGGQAEGGGMFAIRIELCMSNILADFTPLSSRGKRRRRLAAQAAEPCGNVSFEHIFKQVYVGNSSLPEMNFCRKGSPSFSSSAIAKKTGFTRPFCDGGGGGIRTLEPLLTVTRFPVVRPRPN